MGSIKITRRDDYKGGRCRGSGSQFGAVWCHCHPAFCWLLLAGLSSASIGAGCLLDCACPHHFKGQQCSQRMAKLSRPLSLD